MRRQTLRVPGRYIRLARRQSQSLSAAILNEVREIVFHDDTDGEFSITVSSGVAELADESATLDDLIWIADDALYAPKEGGRDRVIATGDATTR
jgi:PleD family two-component response regulator